MRVVAVAAVAAAALGVLVAVVTSGSSGSSSHRRTLATALRSQTGRTGQPAATNRSGRSSSDLARLVGQLIVGRYSGSEPSAAFLARVRAGHLGAVILFADNTAGGLAATRQAIARLQAAARAGGNPPLLIMTDQEGGEVRRLPGPPQLAPADMGSTAVAKAQGAAAGNLLRSAGIDVDLAPVADVERVPNFLGPRSFGPDPGVVARRACAFARGLQAAGVAYTLKHFPGLGRATRDTDLQKVTIDAPAAQLRDDYVAYRACGSSPDALIMVSSAAYPSLSGPAPAVTSRRVYAHELPLALHQPGHLTISDALDTPALGGQPKPALHAIDAGLDLGLFPGNERESAQAYKRLLAAARRGALPESRLRSAVFAVEALKRRLG